MKKFEALFCHKQAGVARSEMNSAAVWLVSRNKCTHWWEIEVPCMMQLSTFALAVGNWHVSALSALEPGRVGKEAWQKVR